MTDETETEEVWDDPDVEICAESRAEYVPWSAPSGKGGVFIFPTGIDQWAMDNAVQLIHVDTTAGVITVQTEMGEKFREIDKPLSTGTVKSIK